MGYQIKFDIFNKYHVIASRFDKKLVLFELCGRVRIFLFFFSIYEIKNLILNDEMFNMINIFLV